MLARHGDIWSEWRARRMKWAACAWMGAIAIAQSSDAALSMGKCSEESLGGPPESAAITWWGKDKLMVMAMTDCTVNEGGKCNMNELWCAKVDAGGDALLGELYSNGFTSVAMIANKYKISDAPLDKCYGNCGEKHRGDIDGEANPIWRCMTDERCRAVTFFENTLSEERLCTEPSCWEMIGYSADSLPLRSDLGTTYFTFSTGFYYKLGANIDLSAELEDCQEFVWAQEGYTLPELAADCTKRDTCTGFVLRESLNGTRRTCLRTAEMTTFAPVKSIENVKVFARSGNAPRIFFGYLAYNSNSAPLHEVIQQFDASSGYSEADCVSMCDLLEDCAGYHLEGSVCRTLMKNIDTNNIGEISGVFYRKRESQLDELSQCEQLKGGCIESSNMITIIIGGVAGLIAIGLLLMFIIGKLRRPVLDVAIPSPNQQSTYRKSAYSDP